MAKAPPPFVSRGAKAAPKRMPPRRPPPSFENSPRDVEKFPEGSPQDMAMDQRQMAGAFRKGGKVGGQFPMGKKVR